MMTEEKSKQPDGVPTAGPAWPGGGGNTNPPPKTPQKKGEKAKRVPSSKRWVFTLNNFTPEHTAWIKSETPKLCSKGVVGIEMAGTGTAHLQGFLMFHKAVRPMELVPFKQIHWEKARAKKPGTELPWDSRQWEYCSKEGNLLIEFGMDDDKPLALDCGPHNFYPWQRSVLDIVEGPPDKRQIQWFWSEEGGLGKTELCKYLVVNHGALIIGGKISDQKNCISEYTKATGYTPKLLIYSLTRSWNHQASWYSGLEDVKDMLFYSGKYEGGMVCGPNPHVIVFANIPPKQSMLSQDRWVIHNVMLGHAWVSAKHNKPRPPPKVQGPLDSFTGGTAASL